MKAKLCQVLLASAFSLIMQVSCHAQSIATSFQNPLKIVPPQSAQVGEWSPGFCGNHLGVDLPKIAGTEVLAIAVGTVKHSATVLGLGNAVHIQHRLPDGSEVTSVYYHMRRVGAGGVALEVGSEVRKGTVIGFLTGLAEDFGTGSHLHFGIRNGTYKTTVDPRTGIWFYPGYTRLSTAACDQSAGTHSIISNEWQRMPLDFISQRSEPLSISVSPTLVPRGRNTTVSWNTGKYSPEECTIAGYLLPSFVPGQNYGSVEVLGIQNAGVYDLKCGTEQVRARVSIAG